MVLARAESLQMLGETVALDAELTALAEKAARRGDDTLQATALSELAMSLRNSGDLRNCSGRQASCEENRGAGLKSKRCVRFSHIEMSQFSAPGNAYKPSAFTAGAGR
jgi:hypothetical protein